jgi:hypothetical protein
MSCSKCSDGFYLYDLACVEFGYYLNESYDFIIIDQMNFQHCIEFDVKTNFCIGCENS